MAPKTSKSTKAKPPPPIKKSPKRAAKPKAKAKAQNGKCDDSIQQLPPEQVHKYTNQWQALGFKPSKNDSTAIDSDVKNNDTDAEGTKHDGAGVAASINSIVISLNIIIK